MNKDATLAPSGTLGLQLLRGGSYSKTPAKELSLFEVIKYGLPWFGNSAHVNLWRARNFPSLLRGLWRVMMARALKIPHFYGALSLVKVSANGERVDYGLASLRVVTTAGVNYLVDGLQSAATDVSLFKFHGFGTGAVAENASDTGLGTEFTTQYASDNIRPTGTQAEGASANIYRSVATFSPDSGGTLAVTEHGILSDADVGQGTLLDRTVFAAVNTVAGSDSIQSTYDLTLAAGS